VQAVIEVTDSNFGHYWSELFANDPLQNPLYSQQTSQYLQHIQSASAFTDRSFVVITEDKPVFACSLTIHTDERGRKCLGYFGLEASTHVNRLSIQSASNNFHQIAVELLQHHISELIDEVKPHSLEYLDPVSCGMMSPVTQVLLEKGAQPIIQTAKIIDLTLSEHALQRKISKSQRGKINWGQRNLDLRVLSGEKFSSSAVAADALSSIFDEAITSGASPYASLETYRQLIQQDKAFLVQALYAEESVASALFVHTDRTCQFVFGSSAQQAPDRPLMPSVMWTALLHCKNLGMARIEMGRLAHASTEKTELAQLLNSFGGDSQTRLKVCLVA